MIGTILSCSLKRQGGHEQILAPRKYGAMARCTLAGWGVTQGSPFQGTGTLGKPSKLKGPTN